MRRKITFPILFSLFFLSPSSFLIASDFDSVALFNRQILVGTSARTLGMGSASVASASEGDSLFWNPSALKLVDQASLSLSNTPFFGNPALRSESAFQTENRANIETGMSIALPLENLPIIDKNLGVLGFSSWLSGWDGDLKKDRVIAGGYGVELKKGFSSGIAIRHHRRNRNDSTGLGWGLDLGVLYAKELDKYVENLAIGASIEDIKTKIKWDGGIRRPIPLSVKSGIAIHPDSETLLAADLTYRNDKEFSLQDRFRAHLGFERWLFDKRFAFRFGYSGITNYDRFAHGEWSRGVSLKSGSGQLDYAYIKGSTGSYLEGGIHWISATLRWGNASNDLVGAAPDISPASPTTTLAPDHAENSESAQLFSVSDELFSPNGDGKGDSINFNFKPIKASDWAFEITDDDDDEIVKSISGLGSPPENYQWDGTDNSGKRLSDGVYTVSFLATYKGEKMPISKASVKIDTQAPEISIFAEPILISPENLNQVASATINQSAYDPSGIKKWNLEIYRTDQKLVGSFSGESKPPDSIKWEEWQVKDREYRCLLRVEDKAGNLSNSETKLFIIDITGLNLKSEESGLVVSLSDSIFVFDKEEIDQSPDSAELIERVSYLIKAYRDSHTLVEVYGDDQKLSESRAEKLSNYLSNRHQIDDKRLIAIGKRGEKSRVDLVVLSEEGEAQLAQIQMEYPRSFVKKGESDYKYTVLAGSFKVRENAENLAEALRRDIVDQEVRVEQATLSSGIWNRVVIGKFSNEEEAKAIAKAVSQLQGLSCVVIRSP